MSDFRQELLAAFDAEHKEHLRAIRGALEDAARGRRTDLKEVFRRAHTLKGAARAVDLPVVEEIAHRLETLFTDIEAGARDLDAEATGVVQLALDGIEGYVAAIPECADPPVPTRAIEALDRLLGAPAPEAPTEIQAPPAHAEQAAPQQDESGVPAAAAVEYLRVAAEQVDRLSRAVHELTGELHRQQASAGVLRRLEMDVRSLGQDWEEVHRRAGLLAEGARGDGATGLAGPGRDLRTRLESLDRNLKAMIRLVSGLSRGQRDAAWALDQSVRRVREEAERMSLVPAEEVLGSLGRMARDIAREEGRDVAVRLENFDLRAERRVLQALKDPVLHMLRNAIGHGVEPEAEREAKGKPRQAEVGVRLASSGGRLELTVFDDGRGPDLARIEAAAVQRGLIEPRGAAEPPLPQDQLLALVFEPGFSTAAEVDRLSGRGMGLSVVAETARALRGGALLRPRRPWGTEVVVSVPSSTALLPLLLVETEGRGFALPTHGVERLLRLKADALERVEGRPAVRIGMGGADVIAPVVPLSALLGSNASIPTDAGYINAVLLRRGARLCAVAVEVLKDVRTLLVSEAEAPGMDADLVSGATLPEDDAPILVLSPEGLVERWMRDESRLAGSGLGLTEARPAQGAPQPTILVVDDSITTRTLQKSILEAQGYRVLLSVDGLDALTVLRGGEAVVDLVVADVEMPRMDGFTLLQAMKNDPRLAPLPVVLMTSRADPADIRRGLELGAGAYVTKQKFDQRELLATIGRLL